MSGIMCVSMTLKFEPAEFQVVLKAAMHSTFSKTHVLLYKFMAAFKL